MCFYLIILMHTFPLQFKSDGLTLTSSSSAVFQDSMSRLGQRPMFISATGADSHSDAVFNHCKHMVCQLQQLFIIKTDYNPLYLNT